MNRKYEYENYNDFGNVIERLFSDYQDYNNMNTDLLEENDNYVLEINLPGFNKDQINISLDNGNLHVFALREKENKKFITKERSHKMSRYYYVGDNYVIEDFKAKYENGVLTIVFPKTAKTNSKKFINID